VEFSEELTRELMIDIQSMSLPEFGKWSTFLEVDNEQVEVTLTSAVVAARRVGRNVYISVLPESQEDAPPQSGSPISPHPGKRVPWGISDPRPRSHVVIGWQSC
jgi:hypothetical protein